MDRNRAIEVLELMVEGLSITGYGTLVSRIKWGWGTLEKLRLPVLPGRDSPWRRFRTGWLSKGQRA